MHVDMEGFTASMITNPHEGGVEHCNINNDSGPKCPWCAAPVYISWIPQWYLISVINFD